MGDEVVAPWFKAIVKSYLPEGTDIDDAMRSRSNEILRFSRLSLNPGDTDAILSDLSNHREKAEQHIQNGLGKITQKRLHAAMSHLFKGGGRGSGPCCRCSWGRRSVGAMRGTTS